MSAIHENRITLINKKQLRNRFKKKINGIVLKKIKKQLRK